jgi:hypothetical protein
MTHPLIDTLNRITQQEARMTDEANDRREGYCDGMAGKCQYGRSVAYASAAQDGEDDFCMLENVAEWKRRAALAPAAVCG